MQPVSTFFAFFINLSILLKFLTQSLGLSLKTNEFSWVKSTPTRSGSKKNTVPCLSMILLFLEMWPRLIQYLAKPMSSSFGSAKAGISMSIDLPGKFLIRPVTLSVFLIRGLLVKYVSILYWALP